MLDPWTPPLLRRAAPEARLLVLLRDPVERFRSGRTLAENRLTVGSTRARRGQRGFQRGVYADQLLRLWRAFPREQVLVLQFERCVADARAELRARSRSWAWTRTPARPRPRARVNEIRGPKVDLSPLADRRPVRRYAPENRRLAALLARPGPVAVGMP